MVKKDKHDHMALVSVVAIVAIVALFLLFFKSGSSTATGEDLTGQGIKGLQKGTTLEPEPEGKYQYLDGVQVWCEEYSHGEVWCCDPAQPGCP